MATAKTGKQCLAAGGARGVLSILRIAAMSVLALAFATPCASLAGVDYADGKIVDEKTQSPENAIRIWRIAAWRNDDFFAQVKLGNIYAGKKKADANISTYDPVEAYVWYFIATRPDQNPAPANYDSGGDDNDAPKATKVVIYKAEDTIRGLQEDAQKGRREMFALLTHEQQEDARNRIVYILASRGSGGFLSLAELFMYRYKKPKKECACVLRARGMKKFMADTWKFWHPNQVKQGVEPQYDREDFKIILQEEMRYDSKGNKEKDYPERCKNENGDWLALGSNVPLDCPKKLWVKDKPPADWVIHDYDDEEALMFATIAERLKHPLAASYIDSITGRIYYDDTKDYENNKDKYYALLDIVEQRAKLFVLPFEFYPAATVGDTPLSDERVPGFAERQALERFHRKMDDPRYQQAIVQALIATSHLPKSAKGAPSPAQFRGAVIAYQGSARFEQTGKLAPGQAVRLIQTAALYGDAPSQDALGVLYTEGEGVEANFPRAKDWFLAAARQQNCNAMKNLGHLYEKGVEGVPQNPLKAGYYKSMAAKCLTGGRGGK